jgi:hypothetical protein
MRASSSPNCFFSAGRSKKPPKLREARFEVADVGKRDGGHATHYKQENMKK